MSVSDIFIYLTLLVGCLVKVLELGLADIPRPEVVVIPAAFNTDSLKENIPPIPYCPPPPKRKDAWVIWLLETTILIVPPLPIPVYVKSVIS